MLPSGVINDDKTYVRKWREFFVFL